MANQDILNFNGLQTKDYNTLLSDIQGNIQNIYAPDGEEINFTSASPDGQITNILSQMGIVIRELLTEIYNSTSPSNCSGAVQDIRYQINYLYRKGGTFTIQNIDITTDRTVTLQGLDGSYNDVNASSYTVSDNAGNLWFLIDTTTIYAGTTSLAFRAKDMGQVIPTVGTITIQNTIIPGVTKVINSTSYTSLGEKQETDLEFRVRREQSTANASTNNVDAIIGEILQLDGVSSLNVWVNNTNSTDGTGTEAHTIWVIVNGGANSDIANIIYSNIGGAETRGNVVQNITTASGQVLPIRFDRPTPVQVYVKFNIKVLGDAEMINLDGIKESIADDVIYKIGQDASSSDIVPVASYALEKNGGYKTSFISDLQIANNTPSATIAYSGENITGATVNAITFTNYFQTSGNYVFTYTGTEWQYNSEGVVLANYGIVVNGEPVASDTLTVTYTSSTWIDLLQSATQADLFVLNKAYIYPTIIEVS